MTHENRLESDREFRDSLSPHTAVVCGVCRDDEQACECAVQAVEVVSDE